MDDLLGDKLSTSCEIGPVVSVTKLIIIEYMHVPRQENIVKLFDMLSVDSMLYCSHTTLHIMLVPALCICLTIISCTMLKAYKLMLYISSSLTLNPSRCRIVCIKQK